jgi:chemotaxis protein CheC
VNQVFSGPVSGYALLVLDDAAAVLLTRLLTGDNTISNAMDSATKEVITEVGNIVLNACLGVFGNLLRVQVSFSVPRLHVDTVEQVFNTITISERELQYALMIHTRFYVQSENVSGYLVIILGVTSLDRLLYEVKQWEERQLAS